MIPRETFCLNAEDSFPFLLTVMPLIAFVVAAQDDDDVVRVNTDLVVLNLTVTDKAGQYVKG